MKRLETFFMCFSNLSLPSNAEENRKYRERTRKYNISKNGDPVPTDRNAWGGAAVLVVFDCFLFPVIVPMLCAVQYHALSGGQGENKQTNKQTNKQQQQQQTSAEGPLPLAHDRG